MSTPSANTTAVAKLGSLRVPAHTVYRGERLVATNGVSVTVNAHGKWVSLTLPALFRSQSTGFEWGYSGWGPMQLAIALVFDATGDRDLTSLCYEWFMKSVVANFPEEWQITAADVLAWIESWEREEHIKSIKLIEQEGGVN